ncbi:MAG: hypothetical protein R3C49_04035 [Planctomycetaceae bacterium]
MADATSAEQTRLTKAAAEVQKAATAGEEAARNASAKAQDAGNKHTQAQRELAQCVTQCAAIAAKIRNKAHYLHAEDREAAGVRQRAEAALATEKAAGQQLLQMLELQKQARNHFDKATRLGAEFQKQRQQVSELAEQRREAARIAEEQQRRAVECIDELRLLEGQLDELNHEKFRPGEAAAIRQQLAPVRAAFEQENFEQVIADGQAPLAALRDFMADVSECQAKWDEERQAAINEQEAVETEVQGIDRDQLVQWCGDSSAVENAWEQLNRARRHFDQEDFVAARRELEEGMGRIRRLAEEAGQNRVRFQQREEIADAIMQALFDQKYDNPEFYFAEQKSNGDDNQLGDLVIFARAPGDKGDMRMQVDLDGHVNLEVQNIPEGEEGLCRQMINGLQEGLAGEVDFQMRDWGRAENVTDDRIRMPLDQPKDRDVTRERESD